MSRNLQCWEKDPFFSAAEQVQDSADRLESAFRAWIHAKNLSPDGHDNGIIDFCRRELSTAFGIAKWQLEEFEKEVSVYVPEPHVEDNASLRRHQFVEAISNQLSSIRSALLSSKDERDAKILASISLGQEESDELTHFLCGSRLSTGDSVIDASSSCSKTVVRFKDMTTSASLFSTSSGIDGRKAFSGSLDECTSSRETGASGNSSEHCLSSKSCLPKESLAYMHEVSVDTGYAESISCAATGLLRGDCHDSVGMCIERANGHHQSASVGGSLSCCTERASGHSRTLSISAELSCCNETGDGRTSHKYAPSSLMSNKWASFFKTGLFVGSGASQSVLKRLKDGEGDLMDLCEMCDSDIEAKCSNLLCQDGKRYKGCSELPQSLRSSRMTVSTRQLVQKIIVILAALGLLGLYLY